MTYAHGHPIEFFLNIQPFPVSEYNQSNTLINCMHLSILPYIRKLKETGQYRVFPIASFPSSYIAYSIG